MRNSWSSLGGDGGTRGRSTELACVCNYYDTIYHSSAIQHKSLYARERGFSWENLVVAIQGLVFTLGAEQNHLWGREQREEGRRSLNTRHLQRLSRICPTEGSQSPNSAPSAACLRTSASGLGFTSHSFQAVLDEWGWDWEEGLMSLVLSVQLYFDWQSIIFIFPKSNLFCPLNW